MDYSPVSGEVEITKRTATFGLWFVGLQILFIVLYGTCTDYSSLLKGPDNAEEDAKSAAMVAEYYPYFQHVHVMIYIGFGFLMTFPKGFNWGGVGFTLLVSAGAWQLSLLTDYFWQTSLKGDSWTKLKIDLPLAITGDFAAAAVMITLGALLGKVGPLQMLVLAMFEIVFYSLNQAIGVVKYQAVDIGGSMYVHMFGGFFGVAASMVLSRGHNQPKAKENAGTTKLTDVFAMVGTVFLWMYWPSFNCALATGSARHRVILNTLLSLLGSCIAGFCCSFVFRGRRRFNMVDIQNATLAGGVAMGTSANLIVHPIGALCVGVSAGLLSTASYNYLLDALDRAIGYHDTCGVLCLHALPGLLGGIVGIITTGLADTDVYGYDMKTVFSDVGRATHTQTEYQVAATFTTLGMALVSGYLCAWIVRLMDPVLDPPGNNNFEDALYWDIEEPEKEPEGNVQEDAQQ